MRHSLFVLTIVAASAGAQTPVHPGSVVRLIPVERYDVRRQGYVVSLSGDSVFVRFAPVPEWELRGDLIGVPARRLEVRTAIKRRAKGGAVVGGMLGATAGFVVGSRAFGSVCEGNSYYGTQQCRRDTSPAGPLALAGALVGTSIGALVGWFAKSETWAPVARVP